MQAYGKVTWDVAAASPITADDVAMAAPVAEAELAVGFFGSRYDRATPAEREYMHAMAELGGPSGAAVATSEVAVSLGRKPASLSPARDSLIKKGLVYSAERGLDRVHRPALRPLPPAPPRLAAAGELGPAGRTERAAAPVPASGGAVGAHRVRTDGQHRHVVLDALPQQLGQQPVAQLVQRRPRYRAEHLPDQGAAVVQRARRGARRARR